MHDVDLGPLRRRIAAGALLAAQARDRAAARVPPPAAPRVYIRFGDAPEGGRSIAQMGRTRNPKLERGVSVFRGWREPDGSYVVDVSPSAMQASMYRLLCREDRDVYLAEGRVAGRGEDDEPVLADVKLTRLPEGTRVGHSGHWFAVLDYALRRSVAGGAREKLPAWARGVPPEMVVGPPRAPYAEPPAAGGEDDLLRPLVAEVLARSTGKASAVHGEDHWKRAAAVGARLLRDGHEADPLVVFLFAALHDSMRVYDGHDNWHGWRAAKLARGLLGGGGLLSGGQLEALARALEDHDLGETSGDPTVGACWDADRLCLWRVGIRPDPALLSTRAARRPETIERARSLQEGGAFRWGDLAASYGLPWEAP